MNSTRSTAPTTRLVATTLVAAACVAFAAHPLPIGAAEAARVPQQQIISKQVGDFRDPSPKMIAAPLTPTPAPAARAGLAQAGVPTRAAVEILDLERAVNQAELIMAARLVEVSETKIVSGGRNETVTQQFRFEPVRILKGIYARDSLTMTGQDLGIYRFAAASDRLERGQLMLVLLARQGQGYLNCATDGDSLGQSIPRLASVDDPLLASISVLVATSRTRDRAAKVAMLRDGLKATISVDPAAPVVEQFRNGPRPGAERAASPLLLAIGRRPLLAARSPGMIDAVAPVLATRSDALRTVAASTLGALLEADPSGPEEFRVKSAGALASSLKGTSANLKAHLATIRSLGAAGPAALKHEAAKGWLADVKMIVPLQESFTSLAEHGATLRALGQIDPAGAADLIVTAYLGLQVDVPEELQSGVSAALSRVGDRERVSLCIKGRMEKKVNAGLGFASEIELAGMLPPGFATPLLLKAAAYPMGRLERHMFAQACLAIRDPRLAAPLGLMLDPGDWNLRQAAVAALEAIDTDEAASILWPHLGEEVYVNNKLHLIAFLGRHGFRDGYAQAVEYLAQPGMCDDAVEALAALNDPRALPELERIWRTSNDAAWNAAALRALARLGRQELSPKLLELARNPADPLAAPALIGLGDLGAAEALPIVRESLASRSDALTIAAIRAAAKLLKRPGLRDDAIRDKIAGLLADANASHEVRIAALDALTELEDPRLPIALDDAARDSGLEGYPLLTRVEAALARVSGDRAARDRNRDRAPAPAPPNVPPGAMKK